MSRLDSELVGRGLVGSRERAKEYIISGQVFVNSTAAKKPSMEVASSDEIEIRGETLKYVGRGGLKLESAIKAFNIEISGLVCLDIGASTGGFTDCMLQNGAKKVLAVDVGHGQLAEKLSNDCRVVSMEGVNVKDLTADMLTEPIDFAASDLSFISARFAAYTLKDILPDGKSAVLLIKPQFEAGRQYLSRSGIVKDKKAHISVLKELCAEFESLGFNVLGLMPSPISGVDGNIEYLIHLVKYNDFTHRDFDFSAIVDAAFKQVKR